MNSIRLTIALLLMLTVASTAYGQGAASVSGVVTDEATGEPLPGASVFIEGTSLGSATDSEGKYRIRRVPGGSHTLVATYIGYSEVRSEIEVAGEDLVRDIEMEYATLEGEDVVVTAQAEGQMAAINQQISAATIKNVVSRDRIQDVPDANAAESVARLPGISLIRSGGEGQKVAVRGLSPKYNVMQVGGVRMQSTDPNDRSVDLNMIAPNILSGIEVTKALTADMDADAVGGTVNLKIGRAPAGLQSRFSVQGGYGSVAETFGNWKATAAASNRFFDDRLGLQLSGYIDDYDRSSDVLNAAYAINEETQSEDGLADIDLRRTIVRDQVTQRRRVGGGLVLDYELPDGLLKFNTFVSNLSEEQVAMENSLELLGNQFRGTATDSEMSNTLLSTALEGEYELGSVRVDFTVSNTISRQYRPGDLNWTIIPQQNQAGFTRSADETATPGEFLNNVEVKDILRVARMYTHERDITESGQHADLNLEVPYKLSSHFTGSIKLGGKYTRNHRDNDETQYYNQLDRTVEGEAFVTDLRESLWTDLGLERTDQNLGIRALLFEDPDYDIGNFIGGDIGLDAFFYTPSMNDMRRLERLAIENGHYYLADRPSFARDFDYERQFGALYAMTELNLGKYVLLLPGIRYETYNMDYSAYFTEKYGPQPEQFSNEPRDSESTSANWFPQLQVRISPVDWLDVRLARTKSIIYPDYRALSPFIYSNTYSGPFMTLGNPDLDPAIATNYDVYASVYQQYVGLFTAGYFTKEIDNLITSFGFRTKDPARINNRYDLPQSTTTDIDTWINLESATTVQGFELDWQTNFWYMPWLLRGLVFNINYTHMTSETAFPFQVLVKTGEGPFGRTELVDSSRVGRMPDQPNDILNATLGYDIGGFSARLAFLYQDNVLASPGVRAELDAYTDALYRWDLVVYQKLPLSGMTMYMNFNNITNSSDDSFVSLRQKLSAVQHYGRTIDVGVRYEF